MARIENDPLISVYLEMNDEKDKAKKTEIEAEPDSKTDVKGDSDKEEPKRKSEADPAVTNKPEPEDEKEVAKEECGKRPTRNEAFNRLMKQ